MTWQGLRIKSWWVFYNEIFSELEYITVNVHAIIWTCIQTYPFTLIAKYHISKLLKKYYIYPQMAKFFHFVLKITLHQWSMTTVNKLNKVGYQFITLVYSFCQLCNGILTCHSIFCSVFLIVTTRYSFSHILPCFKGIFTNVTSNGNIVFIYTRTPKK